MIQKFFFNKTASNEFLLILFSALCYALSFPPFNVSILAWFMFIPIFHFILSEPNRLQIFVRLYLWLLISHVFIVYWICYSTIGGGILAIVFNPLFMMTPVVIYLFTSHKLKSTALKIMIFSLLWISFEYFQTQWELSFPWLILGNSQYLFSYEMQWASLGGTWILTFFVLFFNVLGFYLLQFYLNESKIKTPIVITYISMIMLIFTGGYYLKNQKPAINATSVIGIVQPNIDPWKKWDSDQEVNNFDQLLEQSTKLLDNTNHPDLIIWPETAVPFYLLSDRGNVFYQSLVRFSLENKVAIATGFPNLFIYEDSAVAPPSARFSEWRQKYYHHFNAATLIDGNLTPRSYNKINLVPFAERVPWIDLYPKFKDARFNLAGLGGWGKGQDTINFQLSNNPRIIFPTAICYESAFPDLIRTFSKKGASFISVITNDGWWDETSGYKQHFQFSRLRAIENRKWIVRSANNGISGFIDPFGDVVYQTDFWTQTEIKHQIELISEQSFYVRYGNWLPLLAFITAIILIIYGRIKS